MWPLKWKLLSSTFLQLVVLFIMLNKVGSNPFRVCGWNPQVCWFLSKLLSSCACCLLFLSRGLYLFLSVGIIIQMKATEQCFPVMLFIMLCKVVEPFESVDAILICDHLNESYWAVVSCSAFNYTMESGCDLWVRGSNHWVEPLKGKLPSQILMWCSLGFVGWFLFYSLLMKS